MRRQRLYLLLSFFLFPVLFLSCNGSRFDPGISGIYEAVVTWDSGDEQSQELILIQKGMEISGFVGTIKINGIIDGNEVRFVGVEQWAHLETKIKFTGKVKKGVLEGNYERILRRIIVLQKALGSFTKWEEGTLFDTSPHGKRGTLKAVKK